MTRSDHAGGVVLLLVSLLSVSLPTVARAGEGDMAAARALFVEGRKLVAAGDYAAACLRFADSYKLDPGVGTTFNLADCEEHLGNTASAWLRFLDVAAATKAAGQPDRERVARARAAALEPRVSKLVIKVPTPSPGIGVRRDGDVLPERLWDVALPIDPGAHVVEATAPGRRKWTATVVIGQTSEQASIVVPALEVETPVAALVAARAPASFLVSAPVAPAKDDGRRVPHLSLWLGAIGVASLATGTVLAVKALNENAEAKSLCTTGTEHNVCPRMTDKTQHDLDLKAATRDQTIAIVAGSVGAASAIAAGLWWWRSAHAAGRHSKSDLAIAAVPIVSTNGAQVSVEAVW
jgi:hypothetical protein